MLLVRAQWEEGRDGHEKIIGLLMFQLDQSQRQIFKFKYPSPTLELVNSGCRADLYIPREI